MSQILLSKNKGVIYYFSGTGNSLFIAKEYNRLFIERKIVTEMIDILDLDVVSSQSKYDFIVIVFPVYAWMPPKQVTDFINRLPQVLDKKAYVFATCAHASGGSLKYIQKRLSKKGYAVNYSQEYIMPQNMFLKKQNMNDAKKIINNAKIKVEEDFNQICLGVNNYKKSNIFINILSIIASYFFNRFFISKKSNWIVDYSKCVFCGQCQELCPTNNIIVKKKKQKVVYLNKCVFCARCYNFCPKQAIYYKHTKDEPPLQYNYFKDYFIK